MSRSGFCSITYPILRRSCAVQRPLISTIRESLITRSGMYLRVFAGSTKMIDSGSYLNLIFLFFRSCATSASSHDLYGLGGRSSLPFRADGER